MGGFKKMRAGESALVMILLASCLSVSMAESDSEECWACTDMADDLCKKECTIACDKKGEKKDFERGDYGWRKCFDKCENKCSKKYFYEHCEKLCDDGPPLTPEESRKVVKEHEAKMEKELTEKEAAGINIYGEDYDPEDLRKFTSGSEDDEDEL